jgi:hypothetical protein
VEVASIDVASEPIAAMNLHYMDLLKARLERVLKVLPARNDPHARAALRKVGVLLGRSPKSAKKVGVRYALPDEGVIVDFTFHSDASAASEGAIRITEGLDAALGPLWSQAAATSPALKPEALELVRTAVTLETQASTLWLQAQLDQLREKLDRATHTTAIPAPPKRREIELLDATQFGAALGVGDATVRQRERKREIFGYLPGHRQRGRVYPSFQLWEGVAGEPLKRLLLALGDEPSGRDATFFAAINQDLIGSTPVEVLIGERLTDRDDPRAALDLLKLPPERRLQAVLAAARKFKHAGA